MVLPDPSISLAIAITSSRLPQAASRRRLASPRRMALADQLGMGGRRWRRYTTSAPSKAASIDGAASIPASRAISAARAVSTSPSTTASDAIGVAQESRVQASDPAGSKECDLHATLRMSPPRTGLLDRRNEAARTRRPIAAASDGGPMLASCSTISQPSLVAGRQHLQDPVKIQGTRAELGEQSLADGIAMPA
jgi:hypothetical protein